MSVSGNEHPPILDLEDAIATFVGCMGEAFPDICSHGLVAGEAYVPFNPDDDEDCGEDDVVCSQVWVRVTGINAVSEENMSGSDCAIDYEIGLEVGVYRCYDVPGDGEAPSATESMACALQALADMKTMQEAAYGCEVWSGINFGQWSPLGPMGGQFGGMWTMTAFPL